MWSAPVWLTQRPTFLGGFHVNLEEPSNFVICRTEVFSGRLEKQILLPLWLYRWLDSLPLQRRTVLYLRYSTSGSPPAGLACPSVSVLHRVPLAYTQGPLLPRVGISRAQYTSNSMTKPSQGWHFLWFPVSSLQGHYDFIAVNIPPSMASDKNGSSHQCKVSQN